MRNRVVWWAAVTIGLIVSGSGLAQTNILTNGSFENGQMAPYAIYGAGTGTVVTDCAGAAVPEKPIDGKYCLHMVVAAAGANNWDIGMTDGSRTFQKGKKYTFSCFMKTKSGTLQVRLKPERGADPWEAYNELVATVTDKWVEYYVTTPVIAADVTPASPTFHFAFAPGDFWIDCIKLYEGDYVKTVIGTPMAADEPNPSDKATDIPQDVTLGWKGTKFAATHNVYLGTSFADVNTADVSKAVSTGKADTTFKPVDALEYGKTYYWRVDEVNAAPSNTVFKGDVWSFTVEPYAYPITGVIATASSQEKASTSPANTVNGSGLANDLHSTASDAMWVSSMTGPTPVWIRYEFSKVYKLSELWVWNHNTEFEPVLGYGFKDVTIETSTNGTTWTALKDVQFAQASALPGYAHNTTVEMGGVMARYVRLTAKNNWSLVGLKQFGLSEVRFFHVPVQASAPQPAGNAKDVGVTADLDWRPARDVTSQKVYFGTDKAAVTGGTAPVQTVTTHGFAPGALEFGTTYYWKVDDGDVWKFVTQEYALVEDFESYTDQAGEEIFTAWADGMTNGNGSLVGYLNAGGGTFGETGITHGGKQSMPFEYNNVKAPYYSEAERVFDATQDWTVSGANSLSLWYLGYPTGFADKGNNAFTVSSAGTDIWGNADQFRFIYKPLSGDGSITVNVESLVNTNAWAKAGVMIRETLEANSTMAYAIVSFSSGVAFGQRVNTGAAATDGAPTVTGVAAPRWVKLTRKGNTFTAQYSADGKTWLDFKSPALTGTIASPTITMAATAYVGLCVTSHNAGAYTTAEFSNVSTSGTVTGAWQDLSIGVDQWSNGAAPLYVTVTDKAGKSKTVVNPNAAAVNASAWTQWQVPFSELAGVNLAAVKKLTIGVGDRANPKAGGAGMLYFDDLGYGKPATRDATNYAVNGSFETGELAPWGAWGGGGATVTAAVVKDLAGAAVAEGPVEGSYVLSLKVSQASTNFWDCAFNVAAPTFSKGTKYTLSAFFKVKSGTGKVNMKPEHSAPNWEGYGEKQVTVTDKWAEYYVTTPVFASDVSPASLTFHIGFQAQELLVDNVKFYEGDYVPSK